MELISNLTLLKGFFMQSIQVEVKNIYGVLKIYPVCGAAKIFASIAGTKTLTSRNVKQIEELGYKIENISTASDWRVAA
jgi:hypothetical protein